MAGIDLSIAQSNLDRHIAALNAALSSQRYKIADRELFRAPLDQIQKGVEYWNQQVILLSIRAKGRSRARTVVAG